MEIFGKTLDLSAFIGSRLLDLGQFARDRRARLYPVMEIAFPEVPWKLNKSDWFVTLNPGTDHESEVWFGGLDDKERTEKILGMEFATIFTNALLPGLGHPDELGRISGSGFAFAKKHF